MIRACTANAHLVAMHHSESVRSLAQNKQCLRNLPKSSSCSHDAVQRHRSRDLDSALPIVEEVACRALPQIGDEQQLRRRLRPAKMGATLEDDMVSLNSLERRAGSRTLREQPAHSGP